MALRYPNQRPLMPQNRFTSYTPLITSPKQILNAITHRPFFWRLTPPHSHKPQAKRRKYCARHSNYGHTTRRCQRLKDDIEELVRREYMKEFVRQDKKDGGGPSDCPSRSKAIKKQLMTKAICTVIGATKDLAISKNKRKAHLRSVMTVTRGPPKKTKQIDQWQVQFSVGDMQFSAE